MTITQEQPAVRVVVVDDHLLVADSVAATLSAAPDLEVVAVAASCAEGAAVVRQHQPDVCLLDQRLPDGLGTDLLPELLRLSPNTQVLLVTGSDDADVLERAVQAGCAGLVAKGQRAVTLLDAVRRAASGEAVFSIRDVQRLAARTAAPVRALGDDLTRRERQVLGLLCAGSATPDLARELAISPATARNHIQSVLVKLGAHSKLEAVTTALRENVATLP